MHNDTPDISPVLLWEAHKTVIRGTCICISTQLKRNKKLLMQQLEADYHNLFLRFQSHPTDQNKLLLEKAKAELDLLLAELANNSHRTSHTIYTQTNQPDTFLALRL